ncbi:polysaccharide deacetylase family protein [Desulfosporosinus burensis]
MLKKVIRVLIYTMFVLGISGCGGASMMPSQDPSNQTDTREAPPPTYQAQLEETNPSAVLPDSPANTSRLPSVQEAQAVPILYYHSVMLEVGNEVRMPPDQFEAQMAYLRDNGYQSITLGQLYQAYYQGGSLPPKPFVITFDDGYVDNYTTAFPIMKKYGFTATVFMVSSYIDGEGFLSWAQLKELAANGWEVEGHTTTHPYLTKVDGASLLQELKSSKDLLEKGIGKTVNFFAYPYGDFNSAVLKAVQDTGYLMSFTTQRGWASFTVDEFQVKRVYCYANMGQNEFARRLQNSDY